MKLSISNIAWENSLDNEMYEYLSKVGFHGLEIAPTRIFPENPYESLHKAKDFSEGLMKNYNLEVSSMQSIWFGRTEKLFGTKEEREALLEYTKKAIDFASVINCKNLVFGSPKNRIINNEEDFIIAIDFFRELGDYAYSKSTVLALEPNPVLYGTNFINTTKAAMDLVQKVNSKGFKVNVDLGAIIYNEEEIVLNEANISSVNHIHISEPSLKLIEKRDIHNKLAAILRELKYDNYVSIEMGKREDINEVKAVIKYIKEVFV